MSDLYSEHLVTKEMTGQDKVIKIGLIVLTAIAAAGGIVVNPIILVAAVALGVVDYFFLPRLEVEYEYLHVNGELDIDKIFAKSKRKRAISLEIDQMELLALVNSHRLDSYNNNKSIKKLDFSSQNSSHKIYAMIILKDNELMKVLLEFDERMLEDIKKRAPRKVFSD